MFGQIGASFLPRAALFVGQMPNHPRIPHCITGRGNLRMHKPAGNFRPAVVSDFKSVVADKSRAEPLWLVKFVGVNFGLRVIVGNVA